MTRRERFKTARTALNNGVKDDLIPFLQTRGFEKNPFLRGPLGSYYAGNNIWTYYIARLEAPTEIALLDLYVGPKLTVQFHYNRLVLAEPIPDLAATPGPSPEEDGILHTTHIRNRLVRHGRPRRIFGLHLPELYAMRPRHDPASESARIIRMLRKDLSDLDGLKAEWESSHQPVTIGADGRLIETPARCDN